MWSLKYLGHIYAENYSGASTNRILFSHSSRGHVCGIKMSLAELTTKAQGASLPSQLRLLRAFLACGCVTLISAFIFL